MLTLDQLITEKTKEDLRDVLLLALKGIGFVQHDGTGSGMLSADGTPTDNYEVVIRISTEGELGAGEFEYSLDGGATYAAPVTIPLGGTYALPATGVVIEFVTGPSGADTSFIEEDTYSLTLAVPTFPVNAWQEGGVALTLVELFAEGLADFNTLVRTITRGGLLEYATGAWLSLLSKNVYGTDRRAGAKTVGIVTFSDDAGAGPFTLTAGTVWVQSNSGKKYVLTTGAVLPQSGTVDVEMEAESYGSGYNVGNGTITTLVTSMPGVSVENPDPGSGTWITTPGTDPESDIELKRRCKLKWPALGIGATEDGYRLWALTASDSVTQVEAQEDDTIAGQTNVYIAGPSGGVGGGVVTTVDDYIQPRVPLTSTAVVTSAINLEVTVEAEIFVQSAYLASAQTEVEDNLAALFATNGIGQVLYATSIVEQIMLPTGVRNVEMVSPLTDTEPEFNEVPTLTLDLTFTGV